MIIPILNVGLAVLLIFTLFHVNVFAIQLNFTNILTNDFEKALKSKINNMISNALNETENSLNSSLLANQSNLTSSNFIISKNKVTSLMNSSDTDASSSSIKDQIKTVNGVCTSIKVGGNDNDTLASSGNCNDEFIGGEGADKFQCGEGKDTIKDYNPKEGDVILDQHNCETVL